MKTNDIFKIAIEKGEEADFRGKSGIEKFLKRKNKTYGLLSKQDKEVFDKEALTNPFLDTRIYNISKDKEIKKVLAGIDIGPAEILMAKQLGDIDLIIAHHPLGKGLSHLAEVMNLQCDVLNFYGVPINVAEKLMKVRIQEVARGMNSINHQRTVDMARIMEINLMNNHTGADNLVANYLRKIIEGEEFRFLEDIIERLNVIPEYQEAIKIGTGPKIFVGDKNSRVGRITLTEITGGTEGSPKLFEKLVQAGIGTIIGMHISEEHKKEAEQAHLNVIIAGHISSDSLGMNLFLDELEKRGVEIIACSGLIRVSRN